MAIKNVVGDWIHEEGEIKDFIRYGFELVHYAVLLPSEKGIEWTR